MLKNTGYPIIEIPAQKHGIEKPDPRLFEIAMKEAGCTKKDLLHIGDSLRNNVAGAR